MKVTDRVEFELRRAIRDIIAADPLVSGRKILELIEKKFDRSMNPGYLARLIKKVNREMVPNLDKEKIEHRVRDLRENYRLARERLLHIAYGEVFTNSLGIPMVPSVTEQIRAWETIGRLGKNLLDMEMDLGIYTRHIGELEVNEAREIQLDDATFGKMITAWTNWFKNPPIRRKIETPKIVTVQATPITNEQPKPEPAAAARTIPVVGDAGLVAAE